MEEKEREKLTEESLLKSNFSNTSLLTKYLARTTFDGVFTHQG